MKKILCRNFLITSVVFGAVRLADLLFFTQQDTGFVTVGTVWARYALLMAFALVLLLWPAPSDKIVAAKPIRVPVRSVWLIIAALSFFAGLCKMYYALAQYITPTTNFGQDINGPALQIIAFSLRAVTGLSFCVLGVFCAMMYLRGDAIKPARCTQRTVGFFAVVGFYTLILLRYVENPASVARMLRILPIFSALAALLFFVKLLGLFCKPCTPNYAHHMAANGIFAFFLCTCIELPQTLWLIALGRAEFLEAVFGVTLGVIGMLGGAMALEVSRETK